MIGKNHKNYNPTAHYVIEQQLKLKTICKI